jgi:hypothetical protein
MPLIPVKAEEKAMAQNAPIGKSDIATSNSQGITSGKEGVTVSQSNTVKPKGVMSPVDALVGMGNDLFKVLEVFGISKQEVGRTLLKSFLSGKLNLAGLGMQQEKVTKFERAIRAAKEFVIPIVIVYFAYRLVEIAVLVKWGIKV